MSDKPYYHEANQTIHLRTWALGQMIWGAFLAGVALVGIALFVLAIYGVSLLLPEQSKEAPSPYSALRIEMTDQQA